MKNNIVFKFPVLNFLINSLLISVLFLVIFAILSVYWSFISDKDLLLGAIPSTLFGIGMFTLGVYFMLADSILLKYLRYKKVLSSHSITSADDFVSVTDGKYGDDVDVKLTLEELMDKKYISGFKLNYSDGNFIFPNTEIPEASQPNPQENNGNFTSTESLSDEITNLSNLHAQGILTDEEFQKAKDKLLEH